MAGKPAQVQKKARRDTARHKVWQSMRIMRQFTIPDLVRTTGTTRSNIRKYLWALIRHGFVRHGSDNVRGRTGSYMSYMLVRNPGPDHPVSCDVCGRNLGEECQPHEDTNDA